MEGDNHENKVLWAGVFGVKLTAGIYGLDGLDRQGGNKKIKREFLDLRTTVYLAHLRSILTKVRVRKNKCIDCSHYNVL